jgi:hypothetical protein
MAISYELEGQIDFNEIKKQQTKNYKTKTLRLYLHRGFLFLPCYLSRVSRICSGFLSRFFAFTVTHSAYHFILIAVIPIL